MTSPKYVVVPVEPDVKTLDAAVAFALNVSLDSEYRWSDYMADLYRHMIAQTPATGMVAVRRDLLQKMWSVLEKTDSFNSFSAEEEQEMIEYLGGEA